MRALVTLCCVVQLSLVFSQISVGHQVGVAWSKWELKGVDSDAIAFWKADQERLPGFMFDIPVEYTVTRHLRIGTGATFIQKGYRWNKQQSYYHNYLQVPFTLGTSINVGGLSIRPDLGAAMGWNAGGQYRFDYENAGDASVAPIGVVGEEGLYYVTPALEWSALAGLHLAYSFGRRSLELGCGYQHGLSNVMYVADYVDAYGNPVNAPEAYQRTWFLQLGYRLDIGGAKNAQPGVTNADTTTEATLVLEEPRIRIGQRFGVTYSTIAFNGSLPEENVRIIEGSEPLLAFATALMVDIRLGQHGFLRGELAYTQKGWRCQWYPRPTSDNDLLRMNYAELSILFGYQFGKAALRPFIDAGGVASIGVGGIDRYGRAGAWNGGFYQTESVTFTDGKGGFGYSLFDLSVAVGGGLSFHSRNSEVFVDLRYQYSFVDFYPERGYPLYSESAEAYHRNWLLSIGYLVPWRK